VSSQTFSSDGFSRVSDGQQSAAESLCSANAFAQCIRECFRLDNLQRAGKLHHMPSLLPISRLLVAQIHTAHIRRIDSKSIHD